MVDDKLIMKKDFLWKTFLLAIRGRDDSAGTKNSINHRITNPVSLLYPHIPLQPVNHLRSIIF